MTRLQSRALAVVSLTEETVEDFYNGTRPGAGNERLRALCESHERLRAELEGAEVMREAAEDDAKRQKDKYKMLCGMRNEQLSTVLALTDTGSATFVAAFPLCHASDVPGWRVVEKIREVLLGT